MCNSFKKVLTHGLQWKADRLPSAPDCITYRVNVYVAFLYPCIISYHDIVSHKVDQKYLMIFNDIFSWMILYTNYYCLQSTNAPWFYWHSIQIRMDIRQDSRWRWIKRLQEGRGILLYWIRMAALSMDEWWCELSTNDWLTDWRTERMNNQPTN